MTKSVCMSIIVTRLLFNFLTTIIEVMHLLNILFVDTLQKDNYLVIFYVSVDNSKDFYFFLTNIFLV